MNVLAGETSDGVSDEANNGAEPADRGMTCAASANLRMRGVIINDI
jgi:hypothetical protein